MGAVNGSAVLSILCVLFEIAFVDGYVTVRIISAD